MPELVRVPLANGGSILVEAMDERAGPVMRGRGNGAGVIREAGRTLEESLADIVPASQSMLTQLRELADRPREVTLEFGLKLSAEAGLIVARAGGEANFKVTLCWGEVGPRQADTIDAASG